MADLYLMEDLKNAVGSLIATKHTNKVNILEVSQMAEKYSANKLKELCCEFIFKNLKTLDEKVLMDLYETLPLPLGEKAWQERVKGRAANKVKGTNQTDTFKRRRDFQPTGSGQSDADYKIYLMTHMKRGMHVISNRETWGGYGSMVPLGTIGRVLSFNIMKGPDVQWSGSYGVGTVDQFTDLDLLTTPI